MDLPDNQLIRLLLASMFDLLHTKYGTINIIQASFLIDIILNILNICITIVCWFARSGHYVYINSVLPDWNQDGFRNTMKHCPSVSVKLKVNRTPVLFTHIQEVWRRIACVRQRAKTV